MKRIAAAMAAAGVAVVVAVLLTACGGANTDQLRSRPFAVVSGRVTAGPACPVERVTHPCSPKPLVATIRATVGAHIAASTTSETDGTYRFELPTGAYTISAATAAAFPRCNDKVIEVVAPTDVDINILCDTGIR
jgi:hypothetical protein